MHARFLVITFPLLVLIFPQAITGASLPPSVPAPGPVPASIPAPVSQPVAASHPTDSESGFSLREFYSIKNTLLSSKARGSAAGLNAARRKTDSIAEFVPRDASFHGQDHYERTTSKDGSAQWTHVGRPDQFAYHLFFRVPLLINGTFIEAGAGDGVKASNTLFYEEELGWKGLLIEGSRENFMQLAAEKRRKGSVRTFAAICEERRRSKFVGNGLAAGSLEDMTRHHVESWGKHFRSLEVYDVPCERMDELVRKSGIGTIVDLWSLDIEGGEWRGLNSFDWDNIGVRVLIIEMGKSCFGGGRNRCEDLLRKRGFCRVAKRAVNEFWTSDPGFKKAYCNP